MSNLRGVAWIWMDFEVQICQDFEQCFAAQVSWIAVEKDTVQDHMQINNETTVLI